MCFNSGFLKNVFLLAGLLRVCSWYLARLCQEKELLTEETTPLWEFTGGQPASSASPPTSGTRIRPEQSPVKDFSLTYSISMSFPPFVSLKFHISLPLSKHLSPSN